MTLLFDLQKGRLPLMGILLVHAVSAQAQETLLSRAKALQKPYLVVNPTKIVKGSLREAGYKLFTTDGLSAMVPSTIETIQSPSGGSPDLYEGLPEAIKVTYFLSLLSPQQLNMATSMKGIGLEDVGGEARRVFTSIYGEKFTISRSENGQKVTELTPKERLELRLRFLQTIRAELQLRDQPTSRMIADPDLLQESSDEFKFERSFEDQSQATTSFGFLPKNRVNNVPKPSNIKYTQAPWDQAVSLSTIKASTVQDILDQLVSAKKLPTIIADARVGSLKVALSETGETTVGSLLRSIAVSIGGTYRMIQSQKDRCYVLTQDLTGIAETRLRYAIWEQNLQSFVETQREKWLASMKGVVNKIPLSEDRSLPLTPALRKRLVEASLGSTDLKLNEDEIRSNLSDLIDQFNKTYTSQTASKSSASLSTCVSYRYVYKGEQLRNSNYLAFPFEFRKTNPMTAAAFPPRKLDAKFFQGFSIALRVNSQADVEAIKKMIPAFGIQSLQIECYQPSLVKDLASVVKGKEVRWKLNPFDPALIDGTPSLNRLGKSEIEGFQQGKWLFENAKYATIRSVPSTTNHVSTNQFSLIEPKLKVLSKAYEEAGIVEVAVADWQPEGTGDTVSGAIYGSDAPLWSILESVGFDPQNRIDFLRTNRHDPIDLIPDKIRTRIDQRTKFFFDDQLRGGSSVYDGTQQFDSTSVLPKFYGALGKQYKDELMSLLGRAIDWPKTKVWISPYRQVVHRGRNVYGRLVPFRPSVTFPADREENPLPPAIQPGSLLYWKAIPDRKTKPELSKEMIEGFNIVEKFEQSMSIPYSGAGQTMQPLPVWDLSHFSASEALLKLQSMF